MEFDLQKNNQACSGINEDMRAQAHHGVSGGRGKGILGWSRSWSTCIPLHTLSSFPLTYFFKMSFSATSRVTSLGAVLVEGLRVAANESGVAGRELGVVVGGGMDGPAPRCSAGIHCPGGTCHVASCHMTSMM